MKKKIAIVGLILLSCLPSYAGKSSAAFGGAVLGALIGGLGVAAIASENARHHSCPNTYVHTERVYDCRPQYNWYTEEVQEVCEPVVERRIYTQPACERRVVTTYDTCRPRRYTEVRYNPAPAYGYTECRTVRY